ncbi:hypothetical protein QBC47DRAFT_414421 [Echria macrotheca]|uniref:Uncharacterized protein n=1 Tax=Echria macrotheca TaxID=438768 RepID=A0AAJ0BAH0_9PEZI|nr:hypothetical protein QBC47DRAFT_414421 [Echria macrotheca]
MFSVVLAQVFGLLSWLGPPFLAVFLLYGIFASKALPFAWHIRILYAYLRHYHFNNRPISKSGQDAPTIFQPTIYATTTPPGDLDMSMHKSNSTYLSDLDMARGAHFFCLFREGLKRYADQGRRVFPALGGITCTFKREIRPFEKVDIWTRVLTWDDKWIYLVSHFVRAGLARPSRYSDQPWRAEEAPDEKKEQKFVPFATCISKYVIKRAGKTVPPEEFLSACGLLPEGEEEQIQERRKKGLELAGHVAAVDAGQDWFSGNGEVAFAKY